MRACRCGNPGSPSRLASLLSGSLSSRSWLHRHGRMAATLLKAAVSERSAVQRARPSMLSRSALLRSKHATWAGSAPPVHLRKALSSAMVPAASAGVPDPSGDEPALAMSSTALSLACRL